MSIIKHTKSYPTFKEDMAALDKLANAYNNCGPDMKDTWKSKWYDMVHIVATRAQNWAETCERLEQKKNQKKMGRGYRS